jgi:hypothetical protein
MSDDGKPIRVPLRVFLLKTQTPANELKTSGHTRDSIMRDIGVANQLWAPARIVFQASSVTENDQLTTPGEPSGGLNRYQLNALFYRPEFNQKRGVNVCCVFKLVGSHSDAGWTVDNTCVIEAAPPGNPRLSGKALAHELGHALGLALKAHFDETSLGVPKSLGHVPTTAKDNRIVRNWRENMMSSSNVGGEIFRLLPDQIETARKNARRLAG